MKIEDFEKSKKELEYELLKNNELIKDYNYKKRVLEINSLENKFCLTCASGFLAYMPLTILTILLAKYNLNPFLVSLITMGGSLSIGAIITKHAVKKHKHKEKKREFSNSNSLKEDMEEEVRYEIEIENLKNHNEVIQKSIDKINTDEELFKSVSEKYEIKEKDINGEDINKNIEEATSNLSKCVKKLKVESAKKILRNSFSKVDKFFYSMLIPFISFVLNCVPFMVISSFGYNSGSSLSYFIEGLTAVSIIPISSLVATSVYNYKKSKVEKELFTKLNLELCDNKADKVSYHENKYLEYDETELENIKNEFYINKMKLHECKRNIENINDRDENQLLNNNYHNENSNDFPDNENTQSKAKTLVLQRKNNFKI